MLLHATGAILLLVAGIREAVTGSCRGSGGPLRVEGCVQIRLPPAVSFPLGCFLYLGKELGWTQGLSRVLGGPEAIGQQGERLRAVGSTVCRA